MDGEEEESKQGICLVTTWEPSGALIPGLSETTTLLHGEVGSPLHNSSSGDSRG